MIWEFPIVDGVAPFPGWDTFEEREIRDLSEAVRVAVAQRALVDRRDRLGSLAAVLGAR
jgi:hypothetical protein